MPKPKKAGLKALTKAEALALYDCLFVSLRGLRRLPSDC